MRLLWLFLSVAVTVAVTNGQEQNAQTGQTSNQEQQAQTGQTSNQGQQGQTGQTSNQGQQGQTGQTSNQGQQAQTGQTSNQGQQGPKGQTGQQILGKGQGGGGTKECRDLKHWMQCEDVERKGKCSVSVISNLCRKTCNLCDCADKQSAKFCSRVKTHRNCKNWGLAQNCKRTCNVCGRSAPRNDTQHHCDISGDPHLRNFDGQGASVPFPCLYRVANLLFNISSTTKFSFLGIEVHAASSMETYKNRFYVSHVEVHLTVFDGTINSLVRVHFASFKLNEAKLNAYIKNPSGSSWKIDGHETAIRLAEVGYDFESSQAFLEIYDGSLSILFRPVNRHDKVPQSMRPGLYIDAGDDVVKQELGQFPFSLCSKTDDTRKLSKLASDLKFTTREFLLHTVLRQDLQQSDPQCTLAVSTYKECAMASHSVITKCQPFLERIAVGCLLEQNTKPFDAFLLCLQHMCGSPSASAALDLNNIRRKMSPRCRAHIPDVLE